MADESKKIEFNSFSTSYSGGRVSYYDSQENTQDDKVYCYVCAPSWWAQITIDKNWGTWGRSWTLGANYYDADSNTWKSAMSTGSSAGQWESGSWSYKLYHNSTVGSSSGDVPAATLWELYFRMPELYLKRFWVYAGSLGCMGESKYTTLCKDKPTLIYSSGRLNSVSYYRTTGLNNQDRSGALSMFSGAANRGTQILEKDENKCIWAAPF